MLLIWIVLYFRNKVNFKRSRFIVLGLFNSVLTLLTRVFKIKGGFLTFPKTKQKNSRWRIQDGVCLSLSNLHTGGMFGQSNIA